MERKGASAMASEKTLRYYNEYADAFVQDTKNVSFSEIQDRFTSLLHPGAKILDLGCGSGRDALAFLRKGFLVEAADGSREMVRLCKEAGIPTRQILFEELDACEEYDGLWACASLLHCSPDELEKIFPLLARALKPGGVLYCSFKYGNFQGERNGRYFCDLTESSFLDLISQLDLTVLDLWTSHDVRKGRNDLIWLNVLCRKGIKE